jgi:hypothetical protein
MTGKLGAFASAALMFGLCAWACTEGEVVKGPLSGAGGSSNPQGSAGVTGSGNTVGTAGVTGSGNQAGTAGRGGTTGSGNTVGTAGVTGSGARGGTTGAGNTVGTAGTTGSGNTVGTAGTTGTGNVAGTAGTTGSAGGSGACPATFSVSTNGFVQMPVQGGNCWSGYPYTYADTFGTAVMPMSPTPGFSTCGAGCMLKMTGNIVAVAGMNYSYAGMGFNLGQTSSGSTNTPVAPRGSGLTFNFANTTGGGVVLRAQVTNGTSTWCTDITTSPAVIPYSSFHVACYNTPPGAAYAKEPITAIEMNLAGGTMAGAINLTLTSVTETP